MLRLVPFQPAHREALSYALPPEQLHFSLGPADCFHLLEDADIHAISILAGPTPIGFFLLDNGPRKTLYSDDRRVLLLRAFSLNPAWQGQGRAAEALRQLGALLAEYFPAATTVVLGVNGKNLAAQKTYRRVGFRATGRSFMGLHGRQDIYQWWPEKPGELDEENFTDRPAGGADSEP